MIDLDKHKLILLCKQLFCTGDFMLVEELGTGDVHKNKIQARNQTFLEGGSKSDMVGQMK